MMRKELLLGNEYYADGGMMKKESDGGGRSPGSFGWPYWQLKQTASVYRGDIYTQ